MPEKKDNGGVFEKTDEFIDEKDEFLEDYEKPESDIQRDLKVDLGEQDADVYTESGREILQEHGELEPWEEGFAEGAAQRGHLAKCAHCGKVLSDDETKIVEREYNGRVYRFCSDAHAEAGPDLSHEG